MGTADKDNDAIILKYGLNETIKEGFKLSGSFSAEKDAVLQDRYILTFTNDNPLTSDSYTENTIAGWDKIELEAVKMDDGYGELAFEAELDLKKAFPKDLDNKVIYFVIHGETWDRSDITTFADSDYNYSWDGDSVKISF